MPAGVKGWHDVCRGAIGGAEPAVAGAICNAASATGTNFEYLLATARVESGFNPSASAKTSSAQGLSTLKQSGLNLVYGKYATAISQDQNGQYQVSDPQVRQKIMALRQDLAANAAMAEAFTRKTAVQLATRLGRSATEGELLHGAFSWRQRRVAADFACGRKSKSFRGSSVSEGCAGQPLDLLRRGGKGSLGFGLYASLAGRYATALAGVGTALAAAQATATNRTAAVTPVRATNNVTPLSNVIAAATATGSPAVARAVADGNVTRASFQSLFNDGCTGPVSHVVRDLWTSRPHVAAALSGVEAPPRAGHDDRHGANDYRDSLGPADPARDTGRPRAEHLQRPDVEPPHLSGAGRALTLRSSFQRFMVNGLLNLTRYSPTVPYRRAKLLLWRHS